jgi:hypothetical protein
MRAGPGRAGLLRNSEPFLAAPPLLATLTGSESSNSWLNPSSPLKV